MLRMFHRAQESGDSASAPIFVALGHWRAMLAAPRPSLFFQHLSSSCSASTSFLHLILHLIAGSVLSDPCIAEEYEAARFLLTSQVRCCARSTVSASADMTGAI